jgi:hypothetical protein
MPLCILLARGITSLTGRVFQRNEKTNVETAKTSDLAVSRLHVGSRKTLKSTALPLKSQGPQASPLVRKCTRPELTASAVSIQDPQVSSLVAKWTRPEFIKQVQELPSLDLSKIGVKSSVSSTIAGDPHGNIEQITFPIVRKGLGSFTGKSVFFDMTTHQVVAAPAAGARNNIIELPEIVLNEKYSGNNIIILGDVIDHCSLKQSLKCFYLMTYLLKQQQQIKINNPTYEPLVYILANHELQMFYDNSFWNLEGSITEKRTVFNSIQEMFKEDLMKVSHVEDKTFFTHSCISIDFLHALKSELEGDASRVAKDLEYTDERRKAALEALSYFIHFQTASDGERLFFEKDRFYIILRIATAEEERYKRYLKSLSSHINKLGTCYLPKARFPLRSYDSKFLVNSTVLFSDLGEGSSWDSQTGRFRGKAITPFWARPNFVGWSGKGDFSNINHVEVARAIQSCYGHHKIEGAFGRADKFMNDTTREIHKYKHIVCADGSASHLGPCTLDFTVGRVSRCSLNL